MPTFANWLRQLAESQDEQTAAGLRNMIIALDVDSTVMTHGHPGLGEDIGAIPWLHQAAEAGAVFVLNTMRCDDTLLDAQAWLNRRGVDALLPTQEDWTASTKVFAHFYVDDRNPGTPLRDDRCIDWSRFGPIFIDAIGTRR